MGLAVGVVQRPEEGPPAEWRRVGRKPGEVAGPWARAAGAERSQIGSSERSWQVGIGPLAAHGSAQGHPGAPGLQAGRLGPGSPGHSPLSRRPGRGPPGGRARGRRAPGEPLPRARPSWRTSFPRRRGLGGRLRWPLSARHLPARPGRLGPFRRPPVRRSARPVAAVPRQWSGSRSRSYKGI